MTFTIPARKAIPALVGLFGAVLDCTMTISLHAQVNSGAITGRITDASGAVVSNSSISATNTASGFVRNTQTNSAGLYNFPSLEPGNYHLVITATGFATGTSEVAVSLDQILQANFQLRVAGTQQSIEVSAGSAKVGGLTSPEVYQRMADL
jgi:hypothetical protein